MTDYDALAAKFLSDFALLFSAKEKGRVAPPWCKDEDGIYGGRYKVTLSHEDGHSISFDFWSSYADWRDGKKLTPYSVLACLSSDLHCPDTFEEFCSEYGYDADSRKAEAIFKRASAFAKTLNAFFSDREKERLSEIS